MDSIKKYAVSIGKAVALYAAAYATILTVSKGVQWGVQKVGNMLSQKEDRLSDFINEKTHENKED